ncbi:hypothetical protein ACIBHX_24980 [Nonomuraea sp. NPDC050536]|uniref:hypothetical protein n=1 Tax=Nonomuraea sp. NPDC050536 TaxID=3364366 RepID=UPI0037CC0943
MTRTLGAAVEKARLECEATAADLEAHPLSADRVHAHRRAQALYGWWRLVAGYATDREVNPIRAVDKFGHWIGSYVDSDEDPDTADAAREFLRQAKEVGDT